MQYEETISNNERSAKWFSIICGSLIILFFIYILFYQNGSGPVHHDEALEHPATTQILSSVVPAIKISEIPKIRLSQVPTVVFSEIPAIANQFALQPEFFSEPSIDETTQAITAARADYKKNDSQAIIDTVIVLPEPAASTTTIANRTVTVPQDKSIHKKQLTSKAASASNSSGYTIQLAAFSKESVANVFAAKHHLAGIDKVQHLRSVINGKVWYVLTFGHYQTYTAAQLASKQLPADLQSTKPWAKNLASYVRTYQSS